MTIGDYTKTTYVVGTTGITAAHLNNVEDKVDELDTGLAAHLIDYTSQIDYGGTTGGAANTYTLAAPAISALAEGMGVSFKINVDSTGASTLNWDGKGAVTILKANGNGMAAGSLKAGSVYTVRYNGSNFILQGSGGDGDAVAGDLLFGKKASVDAGDITGTMPNNGEFALGLNEAVPAGYYSGGTTANGAEFQTAAGFSIPADVGSYEIVATTFVPKIIVLYMIVNGNAGVSVFTNFSGSWTASHSNDTISDVTVASTSGNSFTVTNNSGYVATIYKYVALSQVW